MTCIQIKKQLSPAVSLLMLVALAAGLSARADAHSGGRVYPIAYLSDEMLAEIRLDDGRIDEWIELVGEPAMTLLDFSEDQGFPLDPSNLDFQIWLGWHDDPARIYVACVASDDVYKNTHDYDAVRGSLRGNIEMHDSVALAIDGDHSGGVGTDNTSREQSMQVHSETQYYEAIARTVSGPTLDDILIRPWTVLPPYGEGGGGVFGEAPVISVIELYVTPFDHLEEDNPEGSVVSDLTAGKVIGFAIMISDWDQEDWKRRTPEAMQSETNDTRIDITRRRADYFLDGILLPADTEPEGTAVESVSWGRIKASLEME